MVWSGFKILPVGGMIDTGSTSSGFSYVLEAARHMILPVVILSMLGIGSLTRYFRSGMLDVIRQDYIRTARAKGLKRAHCHLEACVEKCAHSGCHPACF